MKGCIAITTLLTLMSTCEGFAHMNALGSRPRSAMVGFYATDEGKASDADDSSYQPQYGVSFIGGDPCGSKYNTDPHDARVEKPGMPDSMKARIQALVDKRKKEEEEKKAQEKEQ